MKNPFLNRKNIRKILKYFNSEKGLKRIPYGLGSLFIAWLCRTSYAKNVFFHKRVQSLNEYLSMAPHQPDHDVIVNGFLETNLLHGWRTSSLSRLSDRSLHKWISFENKELLDAYFQEGKGIVLLNSHYGLPALALSLFPRIGYKNFHTIIGENAEESMKVSGLSDSISPNLLVFKRTGESEHFKMLFRAKDILESGGIVNLLGDGFHGRSNVHMEFFGRMRGWRTTFAELGITSGAPILPVLIIPKRKGKIHVSFLNPLDKGDDGMDHTERVELIVRQYKEILEKRWEENPQYINGGFINMFIRQVSGRRSN